MEAKAFKKALQKNIKKMMPKMTPNWSQRGSQNGAKIVKNEVLEAPCFKGGSQEASRAPPGSISELVQDHFGTSLMTFWDTFRPKLPASPAAPATIAALVLRVGGCPR